MNLTYLTPERIHQFIDTALAEDIGDGDHSTLSSIPADKARQARLLVKADGILAGVEMAQHIFHRFDPNLKIEIFIQDGHAIKKGDVAFIVSGSARSILTSERLVLNCMQRMSGVATYTHRLAKMIAHTKAKLLDTRKTTPNFRIAEKWAVAIGGGTNHRFGLYDMVMLKDNHIDFAGGVKEAIRGTKAYLKEHHKDLRIEVETRNLKEVEEALAEGGVSVIMLDNMPPNIMREAVKLIDGKCQIEASGGITEETIVSVAETGIDFISVGALTHSAGSLDLSLKAF